jgi:hypothetical protein
LKLAELRKEKKLFFSDCCKDKFESKSNGLWTYYVCRCGKKTTPINGKGKMLGMYGKIEKHTVLKT